MSSTYSMYKESVRKSAKKLAADLSTDVGLEQGLETLGIAIIILSMMHGGLRSEADIELLVEAFEQTVRDIVPLGPDGKLKPGLERRPVN